MNIFSRFAIMKQALTGDETATRIYCGNYNLVRSTKDEKLYRCEGKTPAGYVPVIEIDGEYPYDEFGFLLPQYWTLPRLIDGHER